VTNLPPLKVHGVEIADVESKRQEMNENRRALRTAEVLLHQLENQTEQAKSEDVLAAVHARREGKKDPGNRRQKQLETQIERARREVVLLEGLQTELEDEAHHLMRENSAEINRSLGESLEALNTRQLEAIAALEATRSQRQGLLRTMEMAGAFAPSEQPEVQGTGSDYFEVIRHDTNTLFRINDQELGKVVAQLKAEAGHREDLQAVVEQEQGTQDVFFAGTAGMPRPAGYQHFLERKAAREAERARGDGG
jgi:hypothetical protein